MAGVQDEITVVPVRVASIVVDHSMRGTTTNSNITGIIASRLGHLWLAHWPLTHSVLESTPRLSTGYRVRMIIVETLDLSLRANRAMFEGCDG